MNIDFEGRRIILKSKIIWLTKTQNNLLKLIYNNKGRVVTYKEMVYEIYGTECDRLLKNLIRRHIVLLRRKISKHIEIKTVRDVGYIIEEDLK